MAGISAGVVQVLLEANTAGFGRALSLAGRQLGGLQKQVLGIAQSFKFIGGFAALGGIASAIGSISEFQDSLGALKGVLSSSIKGSKELDFNVQQLGLRAREVALDTGFLATELVQAEVEFVRAGLSAKAAAQNLGTVANLARTENIGVAQAAEVATNILLGFNLSAEEFTKVVDLIVSAANSSSSSVLELAESFKFASAISVDFNQSATTIASALGILANSGIKGTLAGTTLRQIFKVLVDDFAKGDSVLKRFNISLFEGGETSQNVTSKFRSITDVLGDLRKKAGTASEFIKIFQARALSGSLILSRQTSEELAKLAQRLGSDVGSAARIGAFRLETLRGQFDKLKASVQEFFLKLGFEGGLLGALTETVQQITGFVRGLASANPRILQLVSALIVSAAKTLAFASAFIAFGAAAAFALSPLGALITSLTALNSGPSLIEKFGPELRQLGDLFLTFAKVIGASFGEILITGMLKGLIFVGEALQSQGIVEGAGFIEDAFLSIFKTLAIAANSAFDAISTYNAEQKDLLKGQIALATSSGLVKAAIDALNEGVATSSSEYDKFGQIISQAEAALNEIGAEYAKLSDVIKTNNPIEELIQSTMLLPGSDETVAKLREIGAEFGRVAVKIEAIKKFGTPAEILQKGSEALQAQLNETERLGLRPFEAETLKLIQNMQQLRAEFEATGGDPAAFDPLIEGLRKARAEADVFTVDLAQGLRNGISQAIRGVLDGTRETIDFGEILKAGLIGAFTDAFEAIILEKLKFDGVFKRNIVDLGSFAKTVFGGIGDFLKGVFGGGADGGLARQAGGAVGGFLGSILGSIGIPGLAKGGIAMSPMIAMIGDNKVGEAVIPLDRLKDFGGGGDVQINVITTEAPQNVSVRQAGGGGSQRAYEIIVGAAAKSVARGGALRQALDTPQVER